MTDPTEFPDLADHLDPPGHADPTAEPTTEPEDATAELMADPVTPELEGADRSRSVDLVLARLHLRLGSLALARAELETLAGRDLLDEAGLVDLAEARWRTGDVAGAGEAAALVVDAEDAGPLLALVVAAEAAHLRGRPTEARRYATAAMAMAGPSIDTIFAGMPRGPVWPPDATASSQPPPTLFEGLTGRPARQSSLVAGLAAGPIARPSDALNDETPTTEPATLELWGATAADGPGREGPGSDPDHEPPSLPAGDAALLAGSAALEAAELERAAAYLGLVLRVSPVLAPAVLDMIGDRRDRDLALVRGDAFRLLGREQEALRAYAEAIDDLDPTDVLPEPPTEGDPA